MSNAIRLYLDEGDRDKKERILAKIESIDALEPVGVCFSCENIIDNLEPNSSEKACPVCGKESVFSIDIILTTFI